MRYETIFLFNEKNINKIERNEILYRYHYKGIENGRASEQTSARQRKRAGQEKGKEWVKDLDSIGNL